MNRRYASKTKSVDDQSARFHELRKAVSRAVQSGIVCDFDPTRHLQELKRRIKRIPS